MSLKPITVNPQAGAIGNDPLLDLDDIQGDVLLGLQKNAEAFLFFGIDDLDGFRQVLKEHLITHVTTAQTVVLREFQIQQQKMAGSDQLLPLSGLNIGFTKNGLEKLAGNVSDLDAAFAEGARDRAKLLNDPVGADEKPSSWVADFDHDAIDGVLLLTGPDNAFVNARSAEVKQLLASTINVVYEEVGHVRPERGHEHFGFLDGVSQPGIRGLTARLNALDHNQGLPAPGPALARHVRLRLFRAGRE